MPRPLVEKQHERERAAAPADPRLLFRAGSLADGLLDGRVGCLEIEAQPRVRVVAERELPWLAEVGDIEGPAQRREVAPGKVRAPLLARVAAQDVLVQFEGLHVTHRVDVDGLAVAPVQPDGIQGEPHVARVHAADGSQPDGVVLGERHQNRELVRVEPDGVIMAGWVVRDRTALDPTDPPCQPVL